jgi:hypothetical protein
VRQADGAQSIGDHLVSARSFSEYQAMFALSDADLGGRVLDRPGGGASFTPRHGARVDALAVDPVYAVPADRLVVRMAGELARGSRWTEEHRDRYVWEHHGSPADHARLRAASAEFFTRDLHAAPERYVPGALPSLPFRDGSVDLVLSSHLPSTYADRLDVDFHNAVPELLAHHAGRSCGRRCAVGRPSGGLRVPAGCHAHAPTGRPLTATTTGARRSPRSRPGPRRGRPGPRGRRR